MKDHRVILPGSFAAIPAVVVQMFENMREYS
jgi:hypothetical protein